MYRSPCFLPPRHCFLAASLILVQAVWAQAPDTDKSVSMSLEEARALRVRAEAMKTEAVQRYATDQEACYKKFLVNDCLESAKTRQMESTLKARELDQLGRDVERAASRRELEVKEATHAAELSQRDAEQQAQAERYRATEAVKAAERERKLADKTRQAEEGRRKTAAEQAARRQKLEQRAKEDAERAAKKAQ